ncbi:DUF4347 domain-containing protein [Kamptonema sp. UHCC 0994]|uniref:DUF4347 domain-containing protein n=1 Tax=Kamptonema sp. UHCC 0994 TaxID=3031329 RepID=UPI0023B8CBA3|nr:DUF4347 domain-containing protein [Kamptonema sp. UHCC 0994]MDF0553527.1 DUF4347 domain-containing protein [Kamptonema sp. UHCC 0994]
MENTQIVFIDSTVEDYQSLAQSAESGKEVFILDATGDGVEQITQLLASCTNISAIHIVSHGGPGSLQLGAIQLNSHNLDVYASQFQQWKNALTTKADILLYGCNVAAQIEGKNFISRLNQLTGADIAASKSLTGSAALGGDWDLEVKIGSIETPLAFSQDAIAAYTSVLTTINVNSTADTIAVDGTITLREAITSLNTNTPVNADLAAIVFNNTNDTIDLTGITGTITLTATLPTINESVTLNGPGAATLTVSGSNAVQILSTANGTVSISNLTFANANTAAGGGGISNGNGVTLNLTNVTFSNNTAGGGGALFNNGGGTATLTNTTFTNNKATAFGGGAIRNQGTMTVTDSSITNNEVTSQGGGGIYSEGTLNITGSTFSGNKASDATWGGGAIYGGGGSTLNLTNTTLSGNTALEKGGAIWWIGTAGTITNSTITNNTADSDATNGANDNGGGIFSSLATIALRNTIIAGNFDASPAAGTINPDVSGNITGNNNNLIGNLTGNTGTLGTGSDIVNLTPGLATLANNGGLTQTHALLAGSPALDNGNIAIAPATDQRSLTRPSGSAADIGAFELQQTVSITAPTATAIEGGSPGTFRISRSDSTVGILTVNLAIDGSSTAVAADYNLSSNFPVTIPNGQAFVDVTLTPVDDTIPEIGETLRLNLGTGNYTIDTTNSNATVTISANDPISYAIALTNPATGSLTEGNSGTQTVTYTVTRSGGIGVASTVDYAIAGTATNGADYNNINANPATTATGTIAFAAGETSKTITLDVLGETLGEADETITATLSNPNLTAAPESSTVTTSTATATITNDDTPSISINDVVVTEGNSGTVNAAFTATLSAASNLPVTVNYATSDGTASTADSDYTAATGSVTFAAGETTKTINVAVNGDTKFEADETFNVNLSTPTNATISKAIGLGTITNDDTLSTQPSISINDLTVTEGNSGTTNAVFTVSLNNASSQAVSVNYATSDGTATIGDSDYTAATGSVTFAAGETTKTITIAVNGDAKFEADETFNVNLSTPTNATIAKATGIGAIANDDLQTPTPTPTPNPNPTPTPTPTPNPNPTPTPTPTPNPTPTPTPTPTPNPTPTPTPTPNPTPTPTPTNTPTPTPTNTPTPTPTNTPTPTPTNTPTPTPTNTPTPTPTPEPQDPDCICKQITFPSLSDIPGPNAVENILNGSDRNDNIIGDNANNSINGLDGSDRLIGQAGNDNIYGGFPNIVPIGPDVDPDLLFGNEGNDYLNGNAGNDAIFAGKDNDIAIGGKDDDLIFGDKGNDTLLGNEGNDTIYGGTLDPSNPDLTGQDLLFGGTGNDYLNGEEGEDTLSGGDGNDTVQGGKGNDIAVGDLGDDLLFGDEGNDTLCSGDGNDTIYGDTGSPLAVGTAGGQDQICGGLGDDLLYGNEGQDTLNGYVGNDTLYGGKDDDYLIGGANDDLLKGDEGNDSLLGGSGKDIFALVIGEGSDIILDFQTGQDLMGLSNGLSFFDLSITQGNNAALIRLASTNELLASVNGISANLINATNFAMI